MITYKQTGDRLDYTPSADVDAGDIVIQNSLVGIATEDIAADAKGSIAVKGVFHFPRTAGTAIEAGEEMYWDGTVATIAASGNTFLGLTDTAVATAATIADIKLIQQPSWDWIS